MDEVRPINDLPKCVKCYLLRSRRFWAGLVVLIFLIGWWNNSIISTGNVTYQKDQALSLRIFNGVLVDDGEEIHDYHMVDFYQLSQQDGGITLSLFRDSPISNQGMLLEGY